MVDHHHARELDAIQVVKPNRAVDAPAVDEGTVSTVEILEKQAIFPQEESSVMTRQLRMVDVHEIVRRPSDAYFGLIQGKARSSGRGQYDEGEVRITHLPAHSPFCPCLLRV
jgi:hypothetical protein